MSSKMKINIKHDSELYLMAEKALKEIRGYDYDDEMILRVMRKYLMEYSEHVVKNDLDQWNKLQKKIANTTKEKETA